MIIQSLLGEFMYEAENTRKLLKAIPDSALNYKPSEINWTIAQLASHIAEVYNWFDSTFNMDKMEMSEYKYDKGDISKAENILAKFEENVKNAQTVLENAKDESMMTPWTMTMHGNELMPPLPRVQVVRTFLFNHLYHHRGEMISLLRASGNKVPSLFGRVAEDDIK